MMRGKKDNASIMRSLPVITVLLLTTLAPRPARADALQPGSLIIPMDLTYQDHGMLQAYGLVYQLLRHGIPVHWAIHWYKAQCVEPESAAPEDCWWACDEWLESEPCPFPSFAPDISRRARILYNDGTNPRETFEEVFHGYRGGTFVIDVRYAVFARPVIDAWNTPALWPHNPWARRDPFRVVTVHEAAEGITLPYGSFELTTPPKAALLADSGEARLAAILRAAGIPQSNGAPFPEAPCSPGSCGPGTVNPDLLPPETLFSESGRTCLALSPVFLDTPLLDQDGRPRYAMLAAAAWSSALREEITCESGPCEEAAGSCFTTPVSFHGRRVLHHLNAFRAADGLILTLGEASYALENVRPDAAWPSLDPQASGHHLTGELPRAPCPCDVPGESCVAEGCLDDQAVPFDCCRPDDPRVRDAGLLPAPVTTMGPATLSLPHGFPVFQFDGGFPHPSGPLGAFSFLGGALVSEARHLDTADGHLVIARPGLVAFSDFTPGVGLPVSQNPDTQVSRIFLNALFSTPVVQEDLPNITVNFYPGNACFEPTGSRLAEWLLAVHIWPARPAEDLVVRALLPDGLELVQCDREFTREADGTILWALGEVDDLLQVHCTMVHSRFDDFAFPIRFNLRFGDRVFSREGFAGSNLPMQYDEDGDGYICDDPEPWSDCRCGDHDGDGQDDCYRDECYFTDDEDYMDEVTMRQPHAICACSAGSRSGPGAGGFLFLVTLALLRSACGPGRRPRPPGRRPRAARGWRPRLSRPW